MGILRYLMAITATRGVLLLVAVWFCVAESQDAVEPLNLLEVAEPDVQKVHAEAQSDKFKANEANDVLTTELFVQNANADDTMQEKEVAATQKALDNAGTSSDLDPVVKAGLSLSAKTSEENRKLQIELAEEKSKNQAIEKSDCQTRLKAAAAEIKERFAAKKDQGDTAQYSAIPFFMYTTLAKKVKASSQHHCEAVCTAQRSCKSFTWNSKSHTCWWSVEKLTYHDDYFYSAKVTGGPKGEEWNDTPGLRWTTPMSKNVYKKSLEQCRQICDDEGSGCSAITYKKTTRTCIRSGEALPTSEHATYYEKLTSKYNTEQADAIAEAQKKITTDCDAKAQAQKVINKSQQEDASQVNSKLRAERLAFQRQKPTVQEKKVLVAQAGKAVDQEVARMMEVRIQEKAKREIARHAKLDRQKARMLKILQAAADKQLKAHRRLKRAQDKLKAKTAKLKTAEKSAEEATTKLTTGLDAVAQAHVSAESALLAFQDIKNSTISNPETKANAKEDVIEMHKDLSMKVQGAEQAHSQEVKTKKKVQNRIKYEALAETRFKAAKTREVEQKRKDQQAVEKSKQAAHKQEVIVAKMKLNRFSSSLSALKAKELVQKQKHAAAAAKQAVLEHKLKSVKASDEKAEENDELKASKEVNTKAAMALGELNSEFKANLGSVMQAKQNYQALLDADKKKKATDHETPDQKIAKVEEGLENESVEPSPLFY